MSPAIRNVYVAAAEGGTGKSVVALGLVDLLARRAARVGVFRPVTRSAGEDDDLVHLLLGHSRTGQDYGSSIGVTYEEVHADADGAMADIVTRYRALERDHHVVVIVGSDYTDVAVPTELTFNARVAANLGAPVLLVVSGLDRSPADVAQVVEITAAELAQTHASAIGVVANRCRAEELDEVLGRLAGCHLPVWALPERPLLAAPLVSDVMDALGGELLYGDAAMLHREAERMLLCGMNVEHVLERLEGGELCIAAGDRPDVLAALAAAHASDAYPSLAGIVLNGGYRPGEAVVRLVQSLDARLPIVLAPHDSFETAGIVSATKGPLAAGTQRKIDTALAVFEDHIDPETVLACLNVPRTSVVTPLMFESTLLERARAERRHIVLPEGDDERILRAASSLVSRQVVDLTLLGNEAAIRSHAASLGLHLRDVPVIDPRRSDLAEGFAEELHRLRAHRGLTLDQARDLMTDVSFFGTMMVHTGAADGMVSGAAHSTAHTITPSFQIIKTAPGIDIVSSVFLMALPDRVLVYGDCAVIPEPTVEELADIAVSSAATAARFGIEPRVAMLSYSTGSSGAGADVDKVREATELVRRRRPDLPVEGPLQYDAAVDLSVARAKLPGSDVAGRATVFIFPDLNTGNNTYKAVQRSAGAMAIGPVLQGLAKPVNDLSRGATVRDVVNTVAITAIQAQGQSRAQGTAGPPPAGAAPTAGTTAEDDQAGVVA